MLDRHIRTHDKCPKPIETSSLPDRVIDCSNIQRPELVITNNVPGVYATLSYVWGRNQYLVSTARNVDFFVKDAFDIKLFPPTIQHVLISAHNWGMRYLWINALCILQDSADDKGRQISQMHKIYTNAHFAIIAACANGVDEGFLQDRPARIPSEMIGYDVTQMYHDEMEPVNYRGWCLQERVLSKRSFIFAADTIKYYCQTEPVNIGDALCEPSTGPRLPEAFSSASAQDLSPEELMWARRSWLFMIWEYSRRSLSRPDEDKLNALAGIAEQYHHILRRSRYHAGLWEHTFLEDLVWQNIGAPTTGPPERSKVYRAPSWSWASVDRHTNMPSLESKLEPGAYDVGQCTVVECNVTLARQGSALAAVTAGYLKLEVFMHEATLEPGSDSSKN
ncbi:heterokaryon incompatibility protein-domain-containing protein [Gymnopilus junonius]|uniref:Heterokaryon incompatibility protein-domain-containing protein n=1 Tax=Gymnopilus junonius TaxID=109634 RepID=A0A9P5NXJ8_GYMJU|nr:heterokaryon incompatibility protein-domain-containing protein [Gymnopilus junonius]